MRRGSSQSNQLLIVAVVVLLVGVGIWYFTRSSPINSTEPKNDASTINDVPPVYLLEVPISFGKPISIGGTDYVVLILFENGFITTSRRYNSVYEFVYVEDIIV